MKKPFLLIMGWDSYPERGTTDWRGCYSSREDATKDVVFHDDFGFYTFVNEKRGENYDWYEIVDLREWTE